MKFILVAVILIFAAPAWAQNGFPKGVSFDLGLGYGKAKIENPDKTEAFYKALALTGRLMMPLLDNDSFATNFVLGVRYLDLDNTANNGAQSEVANMIGPGAGLNIRAYKFFVSGEYYMMLARHHAVGTVSRSSKYEMPVVNLSGGISIPFKQLSVSFSYSQSNGTVPKTSSELSKDCPYTDQIYWLHLNYSTGASPGKFFDFLF